MPKRRKGLTSQITTNWQIAENAFDWYRNSLHWYEMMTASAATIALRLTHIGESIQKNEVPDTVEMVRMVTEKNKALMTSANAASKWQALAWEPKSWPKTVFPWDAANFSVFAAADLLAQSTKWNKMMLDGFAHTLRPYHTTSTANATRLSGKGAKRKK